MYLNRATDSSWRLRWYQCFQPKRNNSPTYSPEGIFPFMQLILGFSFSIQILLVTHIQLVVKWNLQGFSYIKYFKVRSTALHVFLYLCSSMFYMNESISLLHSISFGFVSLFMQMECFINLPLVIIQHLSINSVVSLLYRFSFISMPFFLRTVDRNVGHGSFRSFSFQSIFTRKYSLTWASSDCRLMILMISMSVDGKIEVTRLWVNKGFEPYSKHLVLSVFYYLTTSHWIYS